ncbi:glycosyltransferase family 4 protein [Flavobacterium sp. HSC-61S13]|uniref:glycosyltransferase family 4 protein n=1 Tax=Flavobacterium sp. HSC-61S13 TaxID=2910963 RepID=UPI0020A13CA3|nr:glycosyltransferase family 4 protein [Flavobacterium sp. HSC-61S13]MCP1997432.1 glycosyltransferase involved in cell wall biosynthesis [Flavobacterium sp. HSC-61S13]
MKLKILRITTVPVSLKKLLEGQHRFMTQQGFDVIGVSSKGRDLEAVRDNEGVAVVALEMKRTIAPLADMVSLWNFYKLCKKEKPTIVHSHTPKAGVVGMLGAKLAGVPIRLHTVAGLPLMEATGVKRKLLDFVEKLTYRCATNVYPNSNGLYDFIVENKYTDPNKLKVIGKGSSNGINTAFFDTSHFSSEQLNLLKQDLGISPEDFVFVFVGRLVGDKGINELLKAFVLVSKAKNNIKLLLVGDFEAALDPLETVTLSEINSNKDVISVGFQPDVRPYFAISDALVFPSYREGFPNVVMQAGAMGLPSIVTNINGCNEIIIEGENGLIVPVKDVGAIYRSLLKLYEDNDYFQYLKNNARRMITERYEQKLVWNALLAEYNRLLVDKGFTVQQNNYNV